MVLLHERHADSGSGVYQKIQIPCHEDEVSGIDDSVFYQHIQVLYSPVSDGAGSSDFHYDGSFSGYVLAAAAVLHVVHDCILYRMGTVLLLVVGHERGFPEPDQIGDAGTVLAFGDHVGCQQDQ